MAWEWSHTVEAYQNARNNLAQLDRGTLEIIYAEWRANQTRHSAGVPQCIIDGNGVFDERRYSRALNSTHLKTMPLDILIETIWEWVEQYRTCSNGGWECYLCPYGCGPHCVSFDSSNDLEEGE